jgi:hypothetical protein
MKKNNLSSLITLSLSLEMILSPLPALADNTSKVNASQVMEGLNFGMGLYNQVRGNNPNYGDPLNGSMMPASQMPPQMASDMAELQKQQTPLPDKYFTLQNMQKIPGLMEYIGVMNGLTAATRGKPINPAQLNCTTLPTTLFEANNEVCRNGTINAMAGNIEFQKAEAGAYYNQYLQVEKTYKNYSEDSNVGGQAYGTGCMNDAMQILKGFFDYRTAQLDATIGEMEKALTNFEEQRKAELTSIKQSTAVLNGEDSQFAKEFKNSGIFDYEKRFNDPACNSIFPQKGKDGVSKLGKKTGLLGIEEKLQNDFSTVPEGSKYSPEQFFSKNAEIVADITKMADQVSEQANLNFNEISSGNQGYSSFLDRVGQDVSSETGASQALNKSFFADLQGKFTKVRNQLDEESKLIASELGQGSKLALDQVSKIESETSFNAEVTSLENAMKAKCVSETGVDTALSRVYDPKLSKEANKQTSAQVRKKLTAILNDINLSPEKKIERLKELDTQSANRYEMKLDANYEIQELKADGSIAKKTVSAAGRVTPGGYFTDVIKNCETQFQVNKLNNKLSGKEAIKRLRTLKQDYKKAARQHSQDIRGEIIKKMIDCGGNGAKAASAGVGTCGPDKLDMTKSGFCTKAAFSCSSNMKTCTEKAQKFVKEIKDERLKLTTNYNANVELHRKQLVMIFDNSLKKYTVEAEAMRAQFGAGFTVPTGINRDIQDGTQFDPSFQADANDKLEIKDPKKYLNMVKTNMLALKDQVKAQQDEIIGSNGLLASHIKATKENYQKNVIGQAQSFAQRCLAAYNSYGSIVKDQQDQYNKTMGEMGEKNGELCSKYDQIMTNNPNGACDTFESTGSDALKAAAKAGGNTANIYTMLAEMRDKCKGIGLDKAADICVASLPKEVTDYISKSFENKTMKQICDAVYDAKNGAGICSLKETSPESILAQQKTTPSQDYRPPGFDKNKYKSCDAAWIQGDVVSGSGPDTIYKYNLSCTLNDSYDCSKLEDRIVAVYKAARGQSAGESQSTSVASSCPANNNSGQFNTKSLFPDGSTPAAYQGTNATRQ